MNKLAVVQKFNVRVIGAGEPTLVFAHGFGSDQTAWRHQIEAFSENHRLVLFDYLGCGKSDISSYSPLEYNSLERYKIDLLEIFQELNLHQVIFVGHSVSAMVGALACIDAPGLFDSLVFVGASPRYLNDAGYTGGFEQADLNALYGAMANDYLGWVNGFAPLAMANANQPELGLEFARSLSAMRPDIAQSTARVIFQSDFRARLPLIRRPVLVLQSNRDIAVPVAVGEYLAAHISDSQYRLLNSEGHLPHISAPDEVTESIRGFVQARVAARA